MKIIKQKAEVIAEINSLKQQGKSIGFVPTMGALHQGHLSLIECSNKEDDITVVSIFVNPTQFNNPSDFEKYPRILEDDLVQLKKVKCDILFVPSKEEMYPEEDQREFDFGHLDKVMEGAHRPGHFRGVGLIVSKLFEIVDPDRAYFGEKDFQQIAIIKSLTNRLDLPIEIVSCPIIREPDGLAMSSRNMRLTDQQRENVPLIAKTLFEARDRAKSFSVSETRDWVIRTLNKNASLDVEYFEIVDEQTLLPVDSWEHPGKLRGCIAVHVGDIRLIDNVGFYL
ncbi:MAG: pantoate--beta-alanine ligase [Bacteroidales bacterium]|jgi:pantoate--beta-alanine ligase|nr:pantoate--beta-alanine ligase [Bacteroidales bacterium]